MLLDAALELLDPASDALELLVLDEEDDGAEELELDDEEDEPPSFLEEP